MRRVHVLGPPLLLALSVLVTLTVSEGFFTLLRVRPSLLRVLPATTVRHVRHYYLAYERKIVQAMPECTRYDQPLL
jgi:hypothetical protein